MINIFDETKGFMYENGFYLTSQPYRMGNILSHWELYKMITNLPGGILELGVFKGGSLIQWATFRELLENENSRRIIGFDVFGYFPEDDSIKSDGEFIRKWNKNFEGEFISEEEINKSLALKGIRNVELVKGDIRQTLPAYLEKHGELKLSLLHIDTDVYEACKIGLELLYDRVVEGGLIVFDDYGCVEGETKAADEFFSGKEMELRKFSFSHTKPCYIVKRKGKEILKKYEVEL